MGVNRFRCINTWALVDVLFVLTACGGGGSSHPASGEYSIGGTLSGLASGASVVLQDNGGDPTTVKANGSFTFGSPIPSKSSYAVTVAIQPAAQTCTVTTGSGSGVSSNVTGVSVTCGPATESVIHTFGALPVDGIAPLTMVQGSDGNFYGAARSGGTSGNGTVFEITQVGVAIVLHSFAGGIADGASPNALIQGSDGNLYGTTVNGGPNNLGTVLKF
jgi:uncharacterized repeat protein (TIGR03803 family)